MLGRGVLPTGRAPKYFRFVAKETGSPLVRAVAQEREFVCEALRTLYAPCSPSGHGLAPTVIRSGGLATALGIIRTLSRIVKDAARAETPSLRVLRACYAYLLKYNQPLSTAGVASVAPKVAPPPAAAQLPRASKPDDVIPAQSRTSSPPKYGGQSQSRGAPRFSPGRFSGTSRPSGNFDEPRRRARSRSRAKVRIKQIASWIERLVKGASVRGAPAWTPKVR